jgi:hypothetical protein
MTIARVTPSVERLRDQRGLPRRKGILVAAEPRAPAMPRTIDQDHAMIAREPLAQSQPHVLEIAARAVQQHDRDTTVLRAKFKNVQAPTVDLHRAAGRRMLPLDQERADSRRERQQPDDERDAERDIQDHEGKPGHALLRARGGRSFKYPGPRPSRSGTSRSPALWTDAG